MDKQFAQVWVKALRSGHYQQAQGAWIKDINGCSIGVLSEITPITDVKSFCCLSVAADLKGLLRELIDSWARDVVVCNALNLDRYGALDRFVRMNDEMRWDFNKIADFIEEVYVNEIKDGPVFMEVHRYARRIPRLILSLSNLHSSTSFFTGNHQADKL